jgi:hypothetical protein
MVTFTDDELGILYKLWRNRCFGKGHMLIDNVVDGFPTNIQNQISDSIKNLIRKGVLVRKSTKHGQAVYINLHFRSQIEIELKKKYPFI